MYIRIQNIIMTKKSILKKSVRKEWKPLKSVRMVRISAENIKGTLVISSAKKGERLIID